MKLSIKTGTKNSTNKCKPIQETLVKIFERK